MRVLVTGSSGYLGRVLVGELEDRGHEVVPYDLAEGLDINHKPTLQHAMRDCDAVAHLAAIPFPVAGKRWEDYWRVNVAGTQSVAEVAAEVGAHFVLASSTAYYGAHTGFPFDFTDGMDVISPNAMQRYYGKTLPTMDAKAEASVAYCMSKIAAESIAAAFGMADRMRVTVVRFYPSSKKKRLYLDRIYMSPATAANVVSSVVESEGEGFEIKRACDRC